MILNHDQIIQSNKEGWTSIEPFDEQSVRPASYDLRVGETAVTTSSDGTIDIKDKGYFDLEPGEFAMVLTLEKLTFDLKHCARPDMRTHYTRRGIMPAAGPQVDPGFEGRLKIGLTNFSTKPVRFPYKERLMTIEIHELEEAAPEPYKGRNQGIDGFTVDEVNRISHGEDTGLGGIVRTSRNLSKRVFELEQQVNKVSTQADSNSIVLKGIQKVAEMGTAAVAVGVGVVGLGFVVLLGLADLLR